MVGIAVIAVIEIERGKIRSLRGQAKLIIKLICFILFSLILVI